MKTPDIGLWYMKYLKEMKANLALVVICGLVYWVLRQDDQLRKIENERNNEKLEELKYWREAHSIQATNYFELIKKNQQDAQRMLEQQEHH